MINIASSPPMGWHSTPSVAVSPVVPASAVTPVQGSAREGRTGLGFGQGGQSPQERSTARTEAGTQPAQAPAAPLLPRSQAESGDEPVEASDQIEADKRQAEEQAEELAKEQAVQQQLREVLSNVWQASAAVVERALGLETGDAAVQAASQVAPAVLPEGAVVELPALLGTTGPAAASDVSSEPSVVAEPPEAYDEHGNGNWPSPELGGLVSQRV